MNEYEEHIHPPTVWHLFMKSTIPIPPLAPSQLIRHPFANILLLDWAEAVSHVHDVEEPSNAREVGWSNTYPVTKCSVFCFVFPIPLFVKNHRGTITKEAERRRKGGGKEAEISQGRVIQKACFCVMGPKYPGRTRPHDQEPEWHSGCLESLETACDGSCSNRFQAHRPFESLMTHFLEGKFVLWVIHLLVRGKMIHAAAQVYIIRIHSVTFRRRRMKGETIRHRSFSSVDRASAS